MREIIRLLNRNRVLYDFKRMTLFLALSVRSHQTSTVDVSQSGLKLAGWEQARPIEIEVVGADGTAAWLKAPYREVKDGQAEGVLSTPGGSRFLVTDRFSTTESGLVLDRTVRVLAAGSEKGFSSRFSVATGSPTTIRDREFFIPGVWYLRNQEVPPDALASEPDAEAVLVREDRLPLSLAMVRDPKGGATLELAHLQPEGTAFTGEDHRPRIIDGRMRFGSIGVLNRGNLALAFQYPGSEGDRTYVGGPGKAWALRSHPIQLGFEHKYRLRLTAGTSTKFADAVRSSWRRAFNDAAPKPPTADIDKAYRASMDLLAKYGVRYNGVPSMPFQVRVPDGEVIDKSSQMGFVGKAIPAAALLLKDALDTNDSARKRQAEDLINYWVENSMTPSGVPKTWYDIHNEGPVTWREIPTHLRIASDGMMGVLDAWKLDKRPAWLAFARRYGDFLVFKQEADGSIGGLWNWDGTPNNPYKNVTYQTIPFLIALHSATGDVRYRKAAILAGEYCLATVHKAYSYVGGAPDNPNVTDKEAGILAMQAFLALHSLTGEPRWIAPAAQAGTFCETWTYAWNVPLPKDDPKVVYPQNRTTLGLSIIATGHSGADNCMALTTYDYYRLWILTKDPHYLRYARFISQSTLQMMNWDGTLNYAHKGLLTEVLTLSPPHGHGLHGWLPWLTVAVLEPMVRMKKAFGTYDIDKIETMPYAERLRRVIQNP